MKILITGYPRSGTGYMSKVFRACGLDVPHETSIGKNGVSSWLHIAPGGPAVHWLPNGVKPFIPDTLIHVVRHPVKAIASSLTLHEDALNYMFRFVGKSDYRSKIKAAMHTWLRWNERIERKNPDVRFRVENINTHWPKIKELCNIKCDLPKIDKKTNSRLHQKLSWQDLKKADKKLYKLIKKKAIEYGYSTASESIDPAKISVCMIVKNEQKNLMRCLKSVKPIADEIIVVDTGSTDRTVELVKAQGCIVYKSPWQDDFSYHRNESFSYANYDWILRIDADEELFLNVLPEEFKRQLASIPDECKMTRNMMEDIRGGHVAMQFCQNHFFRKGITWKNRKHNKPIYSGPVFHLADVITRHYGYDIPISDMKRKKERDVKLLEKMIEEGTATPETPFYLSQIYGTYEKNGAEKAKGYVEQYIRDNKNKPNFNPAAYFTAIQCNLKIKDFETAKKHLAESLERYPDDIDLNYVACTIGVKTEDPKLIVCGAYGFLDAWNQLKSNPGVSDGRFTYHFNEESLCYILHKMTIHHLYSGIQNLETFKKHIPNVAEKYKEIIEKDMETDLEKIGVNYKIRQPDKRVA